MQPKSLHFLSPNIISSFISLLFLIIFLILSHNIKAQKLSTEDKIKASYIYNFIRFINWPMENNQKVSKVINVCSFSSSNHFFKAFGPVTGKQVRGRKIILHKITNPKQVAHCDLLYIDKGKKSNLGEILPLINKYSILSVSDINNFCNQGGMICLVKSKGRIGVQINLKVARTAGFNISSNLLEVATIVSSQ